MDELLAFIRARLDEAEAHAIKDLHLLERATAHGDWTGRYGYNLAYSYLAANDPQTEIARFTSQEDRRLADGEEDLHSKDATLVARLVRSAKKRAERVLADVAAKRKILDLHRPDENFSVGDYCLECGDFPCVEWPCATACLLALPFAGHPDYREEWKP
jgi:hypothetical protein